MNPLPPIPQPTNTPAPKPAEPLPGLDLLAYSGAGALFIATQIFSHSHPELAAEVSGNVLGPRMAIRKGQLGANYKNTGLLLAPAPFGFVAPENYHLDPNYVYGLESRARQIGFGLHHFTPPQSTILHNLPDYDPRVRHEKLRERAKEQRRELANLAHGASLGDVLDLIELVRSDAGPKIFFDPAEIEQELIITGIRKAGGVTQFAKAKQAHNVAHVDRVLPAPGAGQGRIPSALDPLPPAGSGGTTPAPATYAPPAYLLGPLSPVSTEPFRPRGTINVRDESLFGPPFAAGRLAPPPSNQQQEAMRRAPELLTELVTERSDP